MPTPDPDKRLCSLLDSPNLWRGSEHSLATTSGAKGHFPGLPTGFSALDASLPWRGWPANALVEIITPLWGSGELQLVLPLLRKISLAGKSALWFSPPCIPYAPALASAGVDIARMIIVTPPATELLWGIEKALQNKACALVLAWPGHLNGKHIRRLQLAAVTGQTLGILFHHRNIRHSASVLRLRAEADDEHIALTVLKARGSYRHDHIRVPWSFHE